MKKITLVLGLLASLSSYAGNGSTGGGIIFGDQLNPWFLANTKEVHYCVEVDPKFSSLSRAEILDKVDYAFKYWKKTFKDATIWMSVGMEFGVGTQEFILDDRCDRETDVRFQLGFLTENQKRQISNYKQLIGLASKTNYDQVNLKAKGFIYIAPEKGSMRPESSVLHPSPWSSGNKSTLTMTLMHELGHVFGLQDDFYSFFGLMSARFVEEVTASDFRSEEDFKDIALFSPLGCNTNYDGYLKTNFETVTVPGSSSEKSNSSIRTELGLPANYEAVFITKNRLMEIIVNGKKFGEIRLKVNSNVSIDRIIDPAVSVYLTSAQKVFENTSSSMMNKSIIAYGKARVINRKGEELKLVDGRSFNVFISYNQYCLPSIGMIYQNEVLTDIFAGY